MNNLELGLRSEQLDWLFPLAWIGAARAPVVELAGYAGDISPKKEWMV